MALPEPILALSGERQGEAWPSSLRLMDEERSRIELNSSASYCTISVLHMFNKASLKFLEQFYKEGK
jgi:hypothetical protein